MEKRTIEEIREELLNQKGSNDLEGLVEQIEAIDINALIQKRDNDE